METLFDRIDSYRDEMIKTLQELISIRSVAGEAEGDMPFGKGVHEAFQYMLDLARRQGFDTFNADNFGGHIEIAGGSKTTMGILTHLDVVPEGQGWDYPPYAGTVADGRIYGRGASDDKGPAVAVLYAMKALKESGYAPEKNIRLILGLDEEAGTGWKGMEAYFRMVKKPDFGITPDAEFPAIHGEKGILIFDLVKKIGKTQGKGIELRSLKGGNAPNMVADSARAVIHADSYEKIREMIDLYRNETGYKVRVKGIGKSLEIVASGVSSHGARPEKGLSAISVIMKLLGRINFVGEDIGEFINFYNNHIGFDLHGERIGCDFFDRVSGRLIFNVGLLEKDSGSIKLTVNIRYPVTMDREQVFDGMRPFLDSCGFGVVRRDHQNPIYLPVDDNLIITLMDVYQKHTGDMDSRPIVIGGGTYARAMENAVAYGMTFPGEPELAHQKNESISIDNLILATKIYADAIQQLTKAE